MTAFEPKPIRVRNIFICSLVLFWASSIMKESFNVLPRMANGAISMIPFSMSRLIFQRQQFDRVHHKGVLDKDLFSVLYPGKKPRFSPASATGLVRTIRLTLSFSNGPAQAMAKNVLPVPAGPAKINVILLYGSDKCRDSLCVALYFFS